MRRSQPIASERSGFVLLVTMLALLVVVSLLATLLDGTRQRHAHLRLRHRVRQAELLVVAGRDFALHRQSETPGYEGEIWEPVIRDEQTARIKVSVVQPNALSAGTIEVSVVLNPEQDHPVRRSGRFTAPAKQSLTEEES